MAVSIFFLVSGTVLTYLFEVSSSSALTQVLRRIARLGLPMAASVILAALWLNLLPDAHLRAGHVINSPWLLTFHPPSLRALPMAREILLSGLFFGHAHFSLVLPGIWGVRLGLPSTLQSYNPPLWTLHLEFYGSLIVLLLVVSGRRLSANAHKIVCCAIMLGLIAHPLGLFVLGYLFSHLLSRQRWQRFAGTRIGSNVAMLSIAVGIGMSCQMAPGWLMHGYDWLSAFEKLPMHIDDFHFYSYFGGILIFFGVLVLPAAQAVLGGPVGRILSRYAFSLYLVHFPIMLTVTAWLVVWMQPFGPVLSTILPCMAGLAVTVIFTVLFERWVDRPATNFSRRIRLPVARPAALSRQKAGRRQWLRSGKTVILKSESASKQ